VTAGRKSARARVTLTTGARSARKPAGEKAYGREVAKVHKREKITRDNVVHCKCGWTSKSKKSTQRAIASHRAHISAMKRKSKAKKKRLYGAPTTPAALGETWDDPNGRMIHSQAKRTREQK
jgi:hypothetical protein